MFYENEKAVARKRVEFRYCVFTVDNQWEYGRHNNQKEEQAQL